MSREVRGRRRRIVTGCVGALALATFAVACDDDDDGDQGPTTGVDDPSGTVAGGAPTLEPGTNQSIPQNQIPNASTADTSGG